MRMLFLAAAFLVFGSAEASEINLKPLSVILYDNGAEVTYGGKVTLKKGLNELTTNGLKITPTSAQARVSVGGSNEIWSSAIEFVKTAEYMRFNAYEEQLGLEIDSLRKEADRWKMTMELIGYNRYLGSENSSLSTVSLKQQLDFVRIKSVEMWNALNALEVEITDRIRKQEQSLAIRAQAMERIRGKVTIFSANGGEEDIRFTLFTHQAKWEAMYEIQADPSKADLELVLKGNVIQTTGDDWNQVKLTFSTGKPAELLKLPILKTWYVSRGVLYFNSKINSKQATPTYYPVIDTLALPNLASRVYDMRTMVLSLEQNEPHPTSAIWRTGIFNNPDQYALQVSNLYDQDGDNIPDYLVQGYGAEIVSRSEYASVQVNGVSVDGFAANMNEVPAVADALEKETFLRQKNLEFNSNLDFARSRNVDVDADGIPDYYDKVLEENNGNSKELVRIIQEFELPQLMDIKSAPLFTVAVIESKRIPVSYTYQVFPSSSVYGYLAAELKDWGTYSLMKAPATVYINGIKTSQTLINPESESSILRLNLGTAQEIAVSKTLLKEVKGKSSSSGQFSTVTFETIVKNNGTSPKTIRINDFTPQSQLYRQGQILDGVKVLENSGAQQSESGELTWNITLEPGSSKKILLQLEIKRGLNSKFLFQ